MHPKVKATNLSYKINEKKLFQNISFELMAGKAIHIQGDNGSGKTTLLKIICGLTNQVKGEIEKKLDKQICFLGHKNALKQYLTVEENLSLLNIINHPDLQQPLIEFGLDKSLDINLLDEPCVGLDTQSQNYLCSFLNNELKLKKSILFSSHISLGINSEKLN